MEEPNPLIRWAMFFFAGGDAGFLGAISVSVIVLLSFLPGHRQWIRPFWTMVGIGLGLLFIACGSLPLPIWFALATLVWLTFVATQLRFRLATVAQPAAPKTSMRRWLLPFTSVVWLAAIVAIEQLSYYPRLPMAPVSTLLVIGDSVTAGLNDGEDTWPRQLSRAANVNVLDASQPGATLRSARKQNELLSGVPGTVILEIGGNDMLEGLAVAKFEEDLARLLKDVVQQGRTVVMFELPLPPFCMAYGLAQRRQAALHGVTLIPKRLFANPLTTKGATVDGIHLSSRGQRQMMELVERFLGARLPKGVGEYQRFERTSNESVR